MGEVLKEYFQMRKYFIKKMQTNVNYWPIKNVSTPFLKITQLLNLFGAILGYTTLPILNCL